ncbi:MAG: hypothetical protein JXA67_10220 [Micromonosporaceae bacterium]|nr:hypothetical protein [Micromonosporaceae bacterium]
MVHGQYELGKHRAAYEAVKRGLEPYRVYRPRNGSDLRRFCRRAWRRRRYVVLLDGAEFDHYQDGLLALRNLVLCGNPRVIVVVVMNTAVYSRFKTQSWIDALWLPVGLPGVELLRAVRDEDTVEFKTAVPEEARGMYEAEWQRLEEHYQSLKKEHPCAADLVDTCVAWQRVGMRSIPLHVLRDLYFSCFARHSADEHAFKKALRIAQKRIGVSKEMGKRPIMAKDRDGNYRVHHHVLEPRRREHAPIATRVWDKAIARATPAEAYDIGIVARELARFDYADKAFSKAESVEMPGAGLACTMLMGEAGRPLMAYGQLDAYADREEDRRRKTAIKIKQAEFSADAWCSDDVIKKFEALQGECQKRGIEAFRIRYNILRQKCERGEIRESLPDLESLERDLRNSHPNARELRFSLQHAIACWTSKTGVSNCLEHSAARFEDLISECEKVYGRNYPAGLAIRSDQLKIQAELAKERSRSDGDGRELATVVKRMEELIEEAEASLGRRNIEVLRIRRRYCRWLGESLRFREAVELYKELETDCGRAFWRTHRLTLRVRAEKAYWSAHPDDETVKQEQKRQALDELKEIIEQEKAVLPAGHPWLKRHEEFIKWIQRGRPPASWIPRPRGESSAARVGRDGGAHGDAGSGAYLTIQPVYETTRKIHGYELFIQSAAGGGAAAARQLPAVDDVIESTYSTLTSTTMAEIIHALPSLKLFVTMSRAFLVEGLTIPLKPDQAMSDQVVLDVPDTVVLDDPVLAGIRRLREKGYQISITLADPEQACDDVLRNVTYVKIDLESTDAWTACSIAEAVQRQQRPPILVGCAIATGDQLGLAAQLPCRLCQGAYFDHVHDLLRISPTRADTGRLRFAIRLLDLDHANERMVTERLRRDSRLSSAALKLCRVRCLQDGARQAHDPNPVTELPEFEMGDLAAAMALKPLPDLDLGSRVMLLTWGRLCELLAHRRNLSGGKAFLAGLVTGLAGYLGTEPRVLLAEQHLDDLIGSRRFAADLLDSIGERDGAIGEVLEAVDAYKRGEIGIGTTPVSEHEFCAMHLEAFRDSLAENLALEAGLRP